MFRSTSRAFPSARSLPMAARSVRRPRRTATEWREILSRYRQSGLSVEAFCARESLSKSSFRRWRERLAARDPASKAAAFVELATSAPLADSSPWTVELELPVGIVLRVHG